VNIDGYMQHVPRIEEWLAEHRLDALVCGLGPTAHLLPWVDQKLLAGIRTWGCHDAFRVMPMDDLVIMDNPSMNLNPDTSRYKHIVEARPKRLWIYDRNAPNWKGHLAKSMASVTQTVSYAVCRPDQVPANLDKLKFQIDADPMHTTSISPTGMTSLAWREGCRRIGVIGVDMMKGFHDTYRWWPVVDTFFRKVATQAHDLGGCIVNLSPITSLKGFREWKPPTSGSAPTAGNTQPAPNECSNTASASTPPVPSSSTGCAPETPTGPSASTAETEPGSSADP
jgi:hypothetical protein